MTKNTLFKIIIFDFDGTIVDTNTCIIRTFNRTLEAMGLPMVDEVSISNLIGLPLRQMYEEILHTDDKGIIDRAFNIYRSLFMGISTTTVTLFPHVAETLHTIHNKGIMMAIATSRGRDSLRALLHTHGIDNYISTDCCEEDVENKKPAPEMVERILSEMGMSAQEALVVGDTWYDIKMGHDAGCATCGVTYGNHSREMLSAHGADTIIDSFDELLQVINKPSHPNETQN
ncbi:MAG: HAD family hydrolase [Prevotella sp.]|nr:HAD family hydrolase [Prevotella sp.]